MRKKGSKNTSTRQPSGSKKLCRRRRNAGVQKKQFEVRCPECKGQFQSQQLLTEHLKERHPSYQAPEVMTCELCGHTFTDRASIVKHMQSHYKSPICFCTLCNETFTEFSTLDVHVKVCRKKKGVCKPRKVMNTDPGIVIVDVDEWARSVEKKEKKHPNLNMRTSNFCGDFRSSSGKMASVKNSVYDNFVCEICGIKFLKIHSLTKHYKTHEQKNTNLDNLNINDKSSNDQSVDDYWKKRCWDAERSLVFVKGDKRAPAIAKPATVTNNSATTMAKLAGIMAESATVISKPNTSIAEPTTTMAELDTIMVEPGTTIAKREMSNPEVTIIIPELDPNNNELSNTIIETEQMFQDNTAGTPTNGQDISATALIDEINESFQSITNHYKTEGFSATTTETFLNYTEDSQGHFSESKEETFNHSSHLPVNDVLEGSLGSMNMELVKVESDSCNSPVPVSQDNTASISKGTLFSDCVGNSMPIDAMYYECIGRDIKTYAVANSAEVPHQVFMNWSSNSSTAFNEQKQQQLLNHSTTPYHDIGGDMHRKTKTVDGGNPQSDYEATVSNAKEINLKIAESKKMFHCEQCKAMFTTEAGFEEHAKSFDHGEKFRLCEVFAKFEEGEEVECEFEVMQNRTMPCLQCGIWFTPEFLNCHYPCVAEDNSCKYCHKTFFSNSEAESHMKLHKDLVQLFQCDKCPQSYLTKSSLDVHYKSHCRQSKECHICGKHVDQVLLKEHVRSHNSSKLGVTHFTCEICGHDFESMLNLASHQYTDHTIDEESVEGSIHYTCPHCKEELPNQKTFIAHVASHTSVYPFECNICNKGFLYQGVLKIHMDRLHLDTPRIFFCEECGKEVYTSGYFDESRPLSTWNYECGDCEIGFRWHDTFEVHMKMHADQIPLRCHLCGETFPVKETWAVHQQLHQQDQALRCDHCNTDFRQKNTQ